MMNAWRGTVCAALILAVALGGCGWSVGGGSRNTIVPPTMGEELADLKKAREADAVTQAEYEKLRKAFLNRGNRR